MVATAERLVWLMLQCPPLSLRGLLCEERLAVGTTHTITDLVWANTLEP